MHHGSADALALILFSGADRFDQRGFRLSVHIDEAVCANIVFANSILVHHQALKTVTVQRRSLPGVIGIHPVPVTGGLPVGVKSQTQSAPFQLFVCVIFAVKEFESHGKIHGYCRLLRIDIIIVVFVCIPAVACGQKCFLHIGQRVVGRHPEFHRTVSGFAEQGKTVGFAESQHGAVEFLEAVFNAHVNVFPVGENAGYKFILFFPEVNIVHGSFSAAVRFLGAHPVDQIVEPFRKPGCHIFVCQILISQKGLKLGKICVRLEFSYLHL